MSRKKHHRIKCPVCSRLNEERLETCYFCANPIPRNRFKSIVKKIKNFLGIPETIKWY